MLSWYRLVYCVETNMYIENIDEFTLYKQVFYIRAYHIFLPLWVITFFKPFTWDIHKCILDVESFNFIIKESNKYGLGNEYFSIIDNFFDI